jgi:hypothetical protein
MNVHLEFGKRYRATVNRKIQSPMALQLVHAQLTASGFRDIKLESVKTGTVVTGTWDRETSDIEIAFDVTSVQKVA